MLNPEHPALLKDGHMAIAKDPSYKPPGSMLGGKLAPSRAPRLPPSSGRSLAVGQQQPQQQQQRRGRLFRGPELPVCVGPAPTGGIVSVSKHKDDSRDWRKLSPDDVTEAFAKLETSIRPPINRVYPRNLRRDPQDTQHFDGLMAAIAVGTLQAFAEASYWAPCFQHPGAVACGEVRTPVSRAIPAPLDISRMQPKGQGQAQINLSPDVAPIDVCQRLVAADRRQRVAMVRFVPAGEPKEATGHSLGDFREAQLHLRTTYLQALQEMPRHLHGDPAQMLEASSVIYTTDVSILRGPVEEGALWNSDAPSMDVITAALQRQPRCDDQGQYARTVEKAIVAKTIDHIFACAAANDVDVLVFTPPGIGGSARCHHPAADAGDLLRKAILAHGQHVPRVWVCKEYPTLALNSWDAFAAAVEHGRRPTEHRELVPIAASPWLRPGWATPRGAAAAARSLSQPLSKGTLRPSCRSPASTLDCTRSVGGTLGASPRAAEASLGSTGMAIVRAC